MGRAHEGSGALGRSFSAEAARASAQAGRSVAALLEALAREKKEAAGAGGLASTQSLLGVLPPRGGSSGLPPVPPAGFGRPGAGAPLRPPLPELTQRPGGGPRSGGGSPSPLRAALRAKLDDEDDVCSLTTSEALSDASVVTYLGDPSTQQGARMMERRNRFLHDTLQKAAEDAVRRAEFLPPIRSGVQQPPQPSSDLGPEQPEAEEAAGVPEG